MTFKKDTDRPLIKAWRIHDDGTVTACELQFAHVGGGGDWYRRAVGCDVIIDQDHSDYFTSEARAHEVNVARLRAKETKYRGLYYEAQRQHIAALTARDNAESPVKVRA